MEYGYQCPYNCDPTLKLKLPQARPSMQNCCAQIYMCICVNHCMTHVVMLPLSPPQLDDHLHPRSGDCPLTEVPCPYKPYGCTFVVSRGGGGGGVYLSGTIHIIESNKVSCNITVQPHWTPVLIWVGHDCVH